MGELKDRFLPKDAVLNGCDFLVTDYQEKTGRFGSEIWLSITTEKPIDENVEFVLSLWQNHIRDYIKNVVKTKIFGKEHFINKKFSIASVKMKDVVVDGKTKSVYGWLPLVFKGNLVEEIHVA